MLNSKLCLESGTSFSRLLCQKLDDGDIESTIKEIDGFKSHLHQLFPGQSIKDNVITPYIHQLINHYPELLRKHKTMGIFQNQGLEASHELMRKKLVNTAPHAGKEIQQPTVECSDGKTRNRKELTDHAHPILQLFSKVYGPMYLSTNTISKATLRPETWLKTFATYQDPCHPRATRISKKDPIITIVRINLQSNPPEPTAQVTMKLIELKQANSLPPFIDQDVMRLSVNEGWVNDSIINYWMKFILRERDQEHRFWTVNTHLTSLFQKNNYKFRWTIPTNWKDFEIVFFPIHVGYVFFPFIHYFPSSLSSTSSFLKLLCFKFGDPRI